MIILWQNQKFSLDFNVYILGLQLLINLLYQLPLGPGPDTWTGPPTDFGALYNLSAPFHIQDGGGGKWEV